MPGPPLPAGTLGGMKTVFLVEDSAPLRKRIAALLNDTGTTKVVGEATTARDAIEAILELRPDAVVLDLNLAQGSGFDVLRAVHEIAPEIDIYMLSNFSSLPYRRYAETLGARGFFDKTTEFDRVRDAITARAHTLH